MLKNNNLLQLSENQVGKIILLFTVLPFIFLCYFNVPLGDDFWYASAYKTKGFLETQVEWFNEWSGRYTATFAISTLNPLSFGHFNLAFIHPLILIGGTILSFRLFIKNIIKVFKLELNNNLVLSVLLFFYFNYIPDFGETFYWMAGAYTYQLPIIFFVLYLNCLVSLLQSRTLFSIVKNNLIALFCLIIVIGSNEVIVVYLCFINLLILLGFIFSDKRLVAQFLPLFIVATILSVIMIFAPGNFARGALFEKPEFHIVKSVFNAFARGSFVIVFWLPTLAFIILLIPNIYKVPNLIPDRFASLNKKKLMFLGIIFLLLVLFVGFFPSIYTTKWIPQRAYTPIFFVFTIFATIFISIAINKVAVLNDLNKILSVKPITSVLLIGIIIVLSHNSNVMNAYVDLTSGKAASYSRQVNATYKILNTSKQDTIYVKDIDKKPLVLPIRWPAKHNKLVNNEWQEYFNVKKVEIE